MDSVALLSVLVRLAPDMAFSLRAVHVDHGISPKAFSRPEVMPSVSAASGALSALFHRIDAQPSGEITE